MNGEDQNGGDHKPMWLFLSRQDSAEKILQGDWAGNTTRTPLSLAAFANESDPSTHVQNESEGFEHMRRGFLVVGFPVPVAVHLIGGKDTTLSRCDAITN
jgi:hypothetical protein